MLIRETEREWEHLKSSLLKKKSMTGYACPRGTKERKAPSTELGHTPIPFLLSPVCQDSWHMGTGGIG